MYPIISLLIFLRQTLEKVFLHWYDLNNVKAKPLREKFNFYGIFKKDIYSKPVVGVNESVEKL